jgi:hypothetical protein
MEETKDPNAQDANENEGTQARDAEATSSETLGDIEESEKVSTGGGAGSSSSETEVNSPKPDGDSGEGRADGSDTGGPM